MDFYEQEPVSLFLKDLEVIEESDSPNYKSIQLLRHQKLGRILLLDNEIQHIEGWAPFYHESLVHVGCAFIESVETVLILGGGCFFTAQEILKYSSVKQVFMVDIDRKVVDMMVRHYDHAQRVIDDPRFHLVIEDAFEFIKETSRKFDFIINDSIDLLSPDIQRNREIFSELLAITNKDGICADMIYRHILEQQGVIATINALKRSNINAAFSLITAPEYPGVLHLLTFWSRANYDMQTMRKPLNAIQQSWMKNAKLNPCKLYDPNHLSFYLYLPPYLRTIMHESRDL